jgi:hypothetical protein
MAISPPSVRPGDIISSELINFVLTQLQLLDGRVGKLETGGASGSQVVITGFDPPSQIAAGQILSVQGNNFAFPPDQNQVTVDGTPILTFRPDSTSSLLRFIVPTTLTIPLDGRNVIIRVQNSQGEAAALYRLLPVITAPGNPPAISTATPVSGPFIFVNQALLITGQNFAANPLNNLIRFRITVSTGVQQVYPQGGAVLNINVANSNTRQIEVTVPDIVEVPSGQSRPVTLEVGVGAQVPAALTINIRRP